MFPTSGSNVSLSLQFTPPYSLFNKSGSEEPAQQQYKWLEYYKVRFDGEWYIPLGEKFVLKTSAKIGIIGAYNNDIGLSPFERYWFGGNGLDAQQGFTGIDLISMRGYNATTDFPVNGNGGATAFNKFSAELRFPIIKSPASTIYAIGFVEAGNAWNDFSDINPFDLKRSAGLGLRVHLPMFGLLGFDYGVGFDKDAIDTGSYLSRYGRMSLILGFEPD
ncbi:MAG: outer membrane protein insertion porin family [Saprospiraceae bacterium]